MSAFDVPDLAEVEGWLAKRESQVADLRPGCAAAIDWAGAPATQTDWAVIYLHGFSASPRELSPVPEGVAQGLGANLHLPRLTGHGRTGAAMAEATLADWQADTARAFEVGRRLGRRVLVMSCSTGGTLAALALATGDTARIAGFVGVAPNFALRSRFAQVVLDLPGSSTWAPWLIGKERAFEVISETHGALWTTRYPTRALAPMGAAVRAMRAADPSRIAVPGFFAFSDADQVVDPAQTHRVMARWGGPTRHRPMVMEPGDDMRAHLVAGDVFSPSQSARLVEDLLDWVRQGRGA